MLLLINLMLGSATVFITMGIQVTVVVMMLRYLLRIMEKSDSRRGFGFETYAIGVILLILFFGHLVQAAIWAALFMYIGEFQDFLTAFYHSCVNFSSLGYG